MTLKQLIEQIFLDQHYIECGVIVAIDVVVIVECPFVEPNIDFVSFLQFHNRRKGNGGELRVTELAIWPPFTRRKTEAPSIEFDWVVKLNE